MKENCSLVNLLTYRTVVRSFCFHSDVAKRMCIIHHHPTRESKIHVEQKVLFISLNFLVAQGFDSRKVSANIGNVVSKNRKNHRVKAKTMWTRKFCSSV